MMETLHDALAWKDRALRVEAERDRLRASINAIKREVRETNIPKSDSHALCMINRIEELILDTTDRIDPH